MTEALSKLNEFLATLTPDMRAQLSLFDPNGRLYSNKLFKSISAKRSFSKNGLPPMSETHCGSSSNSQSTSERHPDAKLKTTNFNLISPLPTIKPCGSVVWQIAESNGGSLAYGSEGDVAYHIRNVFQELLESLGLNATVTMFSEISASKERPDIWLLRLNSIPIGIFLGVLVLSIIGVIEVMKPSEGIMQSGAVLGQTYDYLRRLRSFYGLVDAFAIVTTFQQWRICWLPSDDAAQSTIAGFIPTPTQDNAKDDQE
jgi:hypothetical protein